MPSAFHGEYKVPGGKLVVADTDVTDGRLANVRISGDFFLEPDDALERIDAALAGQPASTDAALLAQRIDAALDPGVVMLGFSAQAVAVAVRRAVAHASDWRDHDWRLINPGPLAPPVHMALDEVLAGEVAAGRRPPTLRLWDWGASAVILGSFQSVRNEVDTAAAEKYGVQIMRRITGGGAMFVEPGNTISYSLYVPESLVAGLSFTDSYAYLDDWVIGALNEELGVKAWYQPINDITSDGGKIGGAAQKRLSAGAVLHHVAMSYDIDADKMVEVLRIGREKLSDKGTRSAKRRVDPLRRQTGLDHDAVVAKLIGYFRTRYGLTDDVVTAEEQAEADRLVTEKFTDPEWTNRVP